VLEALKQQTGVRLFGINNKDQPDQAAAFLAQLGNPYDAIGADSDNRVSIDWGVYGVPETFVVDKHGVIRFKHTGPLSLEDIDKELVPAIARAQNS
jgi:cytochrome c biogenesis protein CcmG/thiol:disulfide interchange protein DsbE